MLKPLLLGTCSAVALTGCFISQPHSQAEKNVNTALTAACLAAHLSPCTIEPSAADKAKAAALRDKAQRDSTAADEDAARRASCLTDTGPRLPVSSKECAKYGATN